MSVVAPKHVDATPFDAAQPFPICRQWVPVQRFFLLRLLQALILVWRGSLMAKRARARVLVLGHWYFAFFGFIARYFFHLPFIVVLHGGELDRFQPNSALHRIAIACIEQSNAIVVNSDYTAQRYRQGGGQHPRIVKITPSVDTRFFAPRVNCEDIIQRHNLRNRRVLLTVSRLVERKGHDAVIRAMPAILKKVPQAVYVIAGTGPQEDNLKSLASEVGVVQQVIFTGYVSEEDLPSYYNACDVFVMPSRQIEGREGIEGFGIVYLEASACGKPVIGGDSGGVAEAMQDGVTGFLVDPLDHGAIANAVIKLLCDPDLSRRLGMQGRERVEREFAWDKQALRLRNALEEVLQ